MPTQGKNSGLLGGLSGLLLLLVAGLVFSGVAGTPKGFLSPDGVTIAKPSASTGDKDRKHDVQFEAYFYVDEDETFVLPRQHRVNATLNRAPVAGKWGNKQEGGWITWKSVVVHNVPDGMELRLSFTSGLTSVNGVGCGIIQDGEYVAGPVRNGTIHSIVCGPVKVSPR